MTRLVLLALLCAVAACSPRSAAPSWEERARRETTIRELLREGVAALREAGDTEEPEGSPMPRADTQRGSNPISPSEREPEQQRPGAQGGDEQGDRALERAKAAFLVAHRLDITDPRPIDGLGCVAARRGELQIAEAHFRRAIELDRAYDRPIAHLAALAETEGDYRAARQLYEYALNLNPMNFRARNNYGVLLANHFTDRSQATDELSKASAAAYGRARAIHRNATVLDAPHPPIPSPTPQP